MALSREIVLDTAYTLLKQYGLADLSMRRLATELGVAPGAIYYHVKNKQELLASLASRMVDHLSFEGPDPQQALLCGALDLYSRVIQVPESAEVIRLALTLHPHTLVVMTTSGQLLSQLGIKEPELAAKCLLHLCLSLIEEEQTGALLRASPPPETAPDIYRIAVHSIITGWDRE